MRAPGRVCAAVAVLCTWASFSAGQPATRIWRVGILAPGNRPEIYAALLETLRGLGYVEGKNLKVEWRVADGHYERLERMGEELAKLPVDVIVTDATPGLEAAERATATIPIAFVVGDPVRAGLVKSLAHPGVNATGIASMTTDMLLKQLEMLRGFVPGLSSVGVLVNPANPSARSHLEILERASPIGGLILVRPFRARTARDLADTFAAMARSRVGALLWVADPLFNQQLRQIAELALKSRLPSIALNWRYAEAGGLMAYGPNPEANWRRLAGYVDKLFRGVKPADLPVEQPTALELVINRKTANALGLVIPPELQVLAQRVIE